MAGFVEQQVGIQRPLAWLDRLEALVAREPTATPTYGATLNKRYLRIAGAIIGGAVSLLAIIIVSPNFDSLPTYMLAAFAVFYPFAYSSLGNARMSYAGEQMGGHFSLVFVGLGPSVLARAPSGSASTNEDQILKTNSETMRVLAEFLEIADDARMEGRTCTVYHDGIFEAAGTLRRISNRLYSIASARVLTQMPQLDSVAGFARERFFQAIRGQLTSWLDFFSGTERFSASAARAIGEKHSADELAEPLNEFSSLLQENGFARLASWPLEPRRTMLAESESMRRLEFLLSELNQYLSDVPSPSRHFSRIEG